MSKLVYRRSPGLTDVETHYCPGCTHGIIHKLVAETMVELDIVESTVGVCPVGCSVFAYKYFSCDMQEAAHGRAPAVATGIKRVLPNSPVFTYQGDGDLASIGIAEIIHAAARGEKFTTIFVNNAIYGMTGGQMAPTTLLGQKTTTSPEGRSLALTGNPIRMSEMLATLDGAVFVERVTVTDVKQLMRAKRAIKRAFELQMKGAGFTFVEVLSTCPTNWGINPKTALTWLMDNMVPVFPLGNFKDVKEEQA